MTSEEMQRLVEELEARVEFLRGQVDDLVEACREKNRKIRRLTAELRGTVIEVETGLQTEVSDGMTEDLKLKIGDFE